jgi:uncharacterized protein YndB with AHSA1/START domain
MDIDVLEKVGTLERVIDTVDRDGQPAKLLVARRTYPTTVDDLWDALTTAERLPRWFLPITGDLHVGGRYQFEGQAGGEVLACDPPRSFEVTWEFGGNVSWLTIELHHRDGETELELRHVAPVPPEMWDEFGPGAVGVGWELALLGLDLHVASGETVDPAEVMAWQTSPAGRDYVARSSEAWGEASIASGTDADAARAAAARTTAFYTGPAPE